MAVLLHAHYTVALFDDDGAVVGEGRQGVYDMDARLLSRFAYTVAGTRPSLAGSAVPAPHRWQAKLVAPSPRRTRDIRGPALPQDAIELAVDRAVERGLVDRLRVTNASAVGIELELGIELEPDFGDVLDLGRRQRVKGDVEQIDEPGEVTWTWRASEGSNAIERGVRLRVTPATLRASARGFEIPVRLEPHGTEDIEVTIESLVDGAWRTPVPARHDAWLNQWEASRTRIEHAGSEVCATADRAARDLAALRNDDLFGGTDQAWFPNAGVPVFTGYFGRDAITTGWQAALLGPEMVRGALEVAARTQASADDAWLDAEPGKLVHEIRRGPLSMLGVVPQAAYYGTQTTSAMFVLALSEHWHWTADTAFLRRHLATALRTFEWAERFGDRDGDGFLEYLKRSPAGLKNQAWKDSDEAIRYPDGRVVEGPIATVEEQAFHALALQRMAEILVAVGDEDRAARFLDEAGRVREAWDRAFWLEEDGFYALALDPAKRPVATVASNPGHALGAGIVPPSRARQVADRLMEPDLFSGWGVRTLSARHPSYNPYAYHLGTVWPVEQATFALGFKRYGLDAHVDRLVAAMLDAAAASPRGRLPELLAGVDRAELPVPVAYPAANAPQAWSASATIQLLQVSLGIYPFAPLGVLALVRPRLPASIPTLTLRNLRVGRARISIRFSRRADGSAEHDVLDRQGRVIVVPVGPPDAEDRPLLERLERLGLRALPGRRGRALRIGLGLAEGS